MVDRAGLAFVVTGQLGELEVADVEDVGDGQLAGCWPLYPITLIELVVKHKELLVRCVENGALVDVLGTSV